MRRFLCLVLVVCLIFSVFALPVSAAATTTLTFGGSEAIAAIIVGLGLTINSLENFEVFNDLVSSVFDSLSAQNILDSAGLITALVTGQRTFLPVSVVQSVFDYLYSSNTVSYSCGVEFNTPASSTVYVDPSRYVTYSVDTNVLIYCSSLGDDYSQVNILAVSSLPNVVVSTTDYSGLKPNANISSSFLYDGNPWFHSYLYSYTYSYNSSWSSYPIINDTPENIAIGILNGTYQASSFETISGLVLEQIAQPDSSILTADAYGPWVDSSVTSPPITLPGGTEDDEAIPYVPVSIPSYSSTTPAIPPAQTVIWSGVQQDTDTEETEPSVPVVPDVGDGDITTSVSSILTAVQSILTSLVEFKDAALDWIQVSWAAFVAGLMDTLTGIKDAIIAIPGVIVGAIEALAATVTSIWEWLQEVFGLTIQKILEILTSIQAWALGLVDALILALSDLLTKIFAVDVAAVQAAVAELRAEFPFFDSIIATGEFLYNGITSGEPPVIYAYLQNAEGRYNWGTTVAVLDMSFYSRYKATGDAILSAALYAFFGWRTFVRLPGIISGAGSDIKEVTNHYDI